MKLFLSVIFFLFLISSFYCEDKKTKKKKDVRDMTDQEIEALYDEWEKNDEDVLSDDEKPPHLRPKPNFEFETLKEMASFF